METSYFAVNIETANVMANGFEYGNEADAWLAALTDGAGNFQRDERGHMCAMENGRQIYSGSSFKRDDQAAKDEAIKQIACNLSLHEFRFQALKVDWSDEGKIVAIDGDADFDLISFWAARIGKGMPDLPSPSKGSQPMCG